MRYLLILAVILTLSNCVKSEFCIEPNAVAMVIDFKTYDSTSLVDTALINASVYDAVNSYDFAANVSRLSTVPIPLDRSVAQQTLIISDTTGRDTIDVFYTQEEVFISNGCGYQTYFELKKATHSTTRIDSVNIIVRKVDNTVQNPHLEVIYK